MAMNVKTFRQQWDDYCDHVDTPRRCASWYDSELHRLRVAYEPERARVRLQQRTNSRDWTTVDTRCWALAGPALARHWAREWLAEEVARRWPDAPAAADNRVGLRKDGRLRTVRTR